jgi:hypothetical protein
VTNNGIGSILVGTSRIQATRTSLLNKLIEIIGIAQIEVRDIPWLQLAWPGLTFHLERNRGVDYVYGGLVGKFSGPEARKNLTVFVCILHAVIGDVSVLSFLSLFKNQ